MNKVGKLLTICCIIVFSVGGYFYFSSINAPQNISYTTATTNGNLQLNECYLWNGKIHTDSSQTYADPACGAFYDKNAIFGIDLTTSGN